MWAQTWSGIMDLAIPYPDATQVDATPAMIAKVTNLTTTSFLFNGGILLSFHVTWPGKPYWVFPTFPTGLECHQDVPRVRQLLHFSGAAAHASRVLGQVHARETQWWTQRGMPCLRLGLLQPQRRQVLWRDVESVASLEHYNARNLVKSFGTFGLITWLLELTCTWLQVWVPPKLPPTHSLCFSPFKMC